MRTLVDWERIDEMERESTERLAEIDRRLQPMLERLAAWKKRCVEVLGGEEER